MNIHFLLFNLMEKSWEVDDFKAHGIPFSMLSIHSNEEDIHPRYSKIWGILLLTLLPWNPILVPRIILLQRGSRSN